MEELKTYQISFNGDKRLDLLIGGFSKSEINYLPEKGITTLTFQCKSNRAERRRLQRIFTKFSSNTRPILLNIHSDACINHKTTESNCIKS